MHAVITLTIVATGRLAGPMAVAESGAANLGAAVKDNTFARSSIVQPIGRLLINVGLTARRLATARLVRSRLGNPFAGGETMSTRRIFLSIVTFFMASVHVHAEEAWLLIFRNKHYEVMHATAASVKSITVCGDYALYADSPEKIAVVSRNSRMHKGSLTLIDKKTQKVSFSWPVQAFPAMKLAGASRDLLLIGDFAYFPGVRHRSDGSIDPNVLGGSFDLIRISMIDGIETSFPLPSEILSPRAAATNGNVLVSNGTREQVWRLNEQTGRVDKLAEADAAIDRHAIIPWTSAALRAGAKESVGSSLGDEKSYIESVAFAGSPRVQVLRRKGSSTHLYFLDPDDFKISWGAEVDVRIVKESLIPVSEDAVAYLDADNASVLLTTSSGVTRELWSLARLTPGITTVDSRIISMNY
jgi:hypothetical protein